MKDTGHHLAREAEVHGAIFDLAGDGFLIVDANGTVLRANAAVAGMFKCKIEEIAARTVDSLFDSLATGFLEPIVLAPANADGSHPVRQVRGLREDGTSFPVDISAERIPKREGHLLVLCLRRPRWVESSPNSSAANTARIGSFGFWSQDLLTNAVSLSAETRSILGLREDSVIPTDAQTLIEFIHPEDRTIFEQAVTKAFETGERLDVTHRIVAKDHRERFVRNVGELRTDSDGTQLEILGVTFDVTDRERAVEALRESEDTLSGIVNSTTAMIYIKDTQGRYLLINRQFENVFHVKDHELRGKSDYDLFPRHIAEPFRANDSRVFQAGEPVEFEERVPHDDGEHIYISIKFPLRRSSGEIYAVCGISTDITERKRVEDELESTRHSLERLVDERTVELRDTNRRLQAEILEREESASELQRLIETAREGIWAIDKEGDTTFANPRMGEILGYDSGEMIGRSVYLFMSDERRPDADTHLDRLRNGISESFEFEFQRKDGSAVWALLSTGPVLDKSGGMVGALAMVTDITERKHAEEYQMLLLQELDHRVKNALATVSALSDLTMERAGSIREFSKAFGGRIQAMARTHEALARARWQAVSFEELVTIVLAPFRTEEPSKIFAAGDSIQIPPRAITPLALTLNELGTNALKHGSLSDRRGTVHLGWKLYDDAHFSLTWRECETTNMTHSPVEGTGLRLIRGLIEYELSGALTLAFEPGGLLCHLEIPAIEGT